MKYQSHKDEILQAELIEKLKAATSRYSGTALCELRNNSITVTNPELTEYVIVYLFPDEQVCVHRTINEGAYIGRDILRVWSRHLPAKEAVRTLRSELLRMLGNRSQIAKDIKAFEDFVLGYRAEDLKYGAA